MCQLDTVFLRSEILEASFASYEHRRCTVRNGCPPLYLTVSQASPTTFATIPKTSNNPLYLKYRYTPAIMHTIFDKLVSFVSLSSTNGFTLRLGHPSYSSFQKKPASSPDLDDNCELWLSRTSETGPWCAHEGSQGSQFWTFLFEVHFNPTIPEKQIIQNIPPGYRPIGKVWFCILHSNILSQGYMQVLKNWVAHKRAYHLPTRYEKMQHQRFPECCT